MSDRSRKLRKLEKVTVSDGRGDIRTLAEIETDVIFNALAVCSGKKSGGQTPGYQPLNALQNDAKYALLVT